MTCICISGTTGFLCKSQVHGLLQGSYCQELGPHPVLCASHLETRPERGRLHKKTAMPCLLPPTPCLRYPSLQDTSGRRGGWRAEFPSRSPFPLSHSAGQIPTSSSVLLPLLPPPPGTQKCTNCFSSLLMLLTKGLRSKAACHRPDLEKHGFPPQLCH